MTSHHGHIECFAERAKWRALFCAFFLACAVFSLSPFNAFAADELVVTYKDSDCVDVVEPEDNQTLQEAIDEIKEDPRVDCVEENQFFHLQKTANDPYATSATSYYLNTHDFYGAWDTAQTDGAVTVAVLDTGISKYSPYRIPDLDGIVDYDNAWDATSGRSGNPLSTNFIDNYQHGTEVASVLAAKANNQIGTAGASYNARVLPINIFNGQETSSAMLVRAYNHVLDVADELNIRVVNLSIAGEADSTMLTSLQSVINKAHDQGIVTIAAAGNHSDKALSEQAMKYYPASLDNVVSVASVDKNSTRPWWSFHNNAVDLAAAGVDIPIPKLSYLTDANGAKRQYVTYSGSVADGTSYSAPLVSGTAALMFTANPNLDADTAVELLNNSTMDLGASGKDQYFGNGELNAAHAVYAAASSPDKVHKFTRTVQQPATYSKRGSYHYFCNACGYSFALNNAIPVKAVKLKSLTPAKKKLTAKWTKADAVSGYVLSYRKKGASSWKQLKVAPSKKKYVLKSLKTKTKYQVRMRAYTESGSSTIYSAYSSTLAKKTK